LAPAGTPAAVVGKVHADIVQIAVRADMRERIAQLGLEPSLNSPEEFAVVIKTDTATSGFIRHALCAASRWPALVLTGGGFDLSEA
jgi:tripartite-type tricarboxylate transporter receptor subunit TctC